MKMNIVIYSRSTGMLMNEIKSNVKKGRLVGWTLHSKTWKDYNVLICNPNTGYRPLQVCISQNYYSVKITPLWIDEKHMWTKEGKYIGIKGDTHEMKGYYLGKIANMLLSNFPYRVSKLEIERQ